MESECIVSWKISLFQFSELHIMGSSELRP